MKSRIVMFLAAVALVAAGRLVADDAPEAVDFTKIKCVVSGKAVNPEATLAYRDGLVYFCCEGCPGAFKSDAKKFAVKANHQLVATHQAEQVGCPMSGKAVADGTEVDVNGVKVAFCCNNCKGAAEKKTGDEQVELIFNDKAFDKAFKVAKKAE